MATSAYILIEAEVGKIKNILKAFKKIKEVKSVEAVTGLYDLIVHIETKNIDVLGRIVIDQIRRTKGIKRTITCLTVDL